MAADPFFNRSAVGTRSAALRRTVRWLAGDRQGVAAIEFAILAIPFIVIILFIFQVSVYHFGLQSLDHATRLAARQIMLGQVPDSAKSRGTFKTTQLCPNLLLNFACDDVIVNVSRIAADASEGPGAILSTFIDTAAMRLKPSATSFCIGGPGDYIFIDVSYRLPSFLGNLLTNGGSSSYQLRSTNFFRNEPYKGKGMSC